MTNSKTGQCLCGAVQFTAQNVPTGFSTCHCDMCKRWSGAGFSAVSVQENDVVFSNRDSISTLKTSAWAERAFCQSCGSGLWCRLSEGPNAARLGIALGLFDDTTGMLLEQEYYVDRKNSTHTFPADRIQLTEAELMALYAPQPQPEST